MFNRGGAARTTRRVGEWCESSVFALAVFVFQHYLLGMCFRMQLGLGRAAPSSPSCAAGSNERRQQQLGTRDGRQRWVNATKANMGHNHTYPASHVNRRSLNGLPSF